MDRERHRERVLWEREAEGIAMDEHTHQLYAAAKLVTDFIELTSENTPDDRYTEMRTEFRFHGTCYVSVSNSPYVDPFLDKMTILKLFVQRFELEHPEVKA